jgi:alkylhydroperoxidase/carboxymuconolactone decarboxylase family protein YurZ
MLYEETSMLSLNQTLDQQFAEFAEQVLEGDMLPDRERAIAILATTLTLEDNTAARNAIISAKQAGLTNDEIGYVSAIVIAMRAQRINRLGTAEAPTLSLKPVQANCCG